MLFKPGGLPWVFAAGTELSHHCCCLQGREGEPTAVTALTAPLMQSEVSIENKLKLIFQEQIDPGISTRQRGAKFLQLSFCCCTDHLK